MRATYLKLCVILCVVAMAGCPQPVVPPPPNDADATTPEPIPSLDAETDEATHATCLQFCAHLAIIPCPEGKDPACEQVCTRVRATGLTNLHESCVLRAKTADAVRACGPQVTCSE